MRLCQRFKFIHVLAKKWQLDMNRGPQARTKVGRARSQIAKVLVLSECYSTLFQRSEGLINSSVNANRIVEELQRDDSELVLLVDPQPESFLLVVEDATALWPVFLQTGSLQESIIILEQEVVFHKLGLLLICHRKQ